jgi:UDP-3-O-[3-hydroxymyristoyl] glucosamine N-acyltransferase
MVSGSPAVENALWLRAVAAFPQLPGLVRKVRALEREVRELKNGPQPKNIK